jgi:hypothetical protein
LDPKLKWRLAKFAEEHPDLYKLEREDELGGVSYQLEKSRFSYRLIAFYSKERHSKSSAQMRMINLS